jgi:transcription elongation factor GreA
VEDAAAAPAAAATSSVARGDDEGELLTPAAHAQLEAELAELEGPKRKAVVQAIATARAHGDLSENFEYHAAKNEQGLLEARIRVLRHRLQHATVLDEEEAAASGVVTVGSRVEVEREDGTRHEFEITSVGGVSPDSPVGQALLGKAPGDEIEVDAPRGRWRARIVSVGRAS